MKKIFSLFISIKKNIKILFINLFDYFNLTKKIRFKKLSLILNNDTILNIPIFFVAPAAVGAAKAAQVAKTGAQVAKAGAQAGKAAKGAQAGSKATKTALDGSKKTLESPQKKSWRQKYLEKKARESLNKDEDESSQAPDNSIDLISPGGCFLIVIAIIFDLTNLICLGISFIDGGIISQPVSFAVSVVATIIFGIWIIFRLKNYRKGSQILKQIGKKAGKRYLLFGLFDLIPYVGDIPSWTIFVLWTLREKK